MAMHAWMNMNEKPCGATTEARGRVELEVRRQVLGMVRVDRFHRHRLVGRIAQRRTVPACRPSSRELGRRLLVDLVLHDRLAVRVDLRLAVLHDLLLRDDVVDRWPR